MSLFDRLRSAWESLAGWNDKLPMKWREAEAKLRSMNVYRMVEVPIETVVHGGYEPGDGPTTEHVLAFYHYLDGYHICYGVRQTCDLEASDTEVWKPILECSYAQQAKAALKFPELQLKLVEKAEDMACEVEQAVGALAEGIAKT